jgi:hypothetical protein
MYFIKFQKIKIFFIIFCASIILSLLTTLLFTKNISGKTKITFVIKEDHNSELYFLFNKHKFLEAHFESARLKYFINKFKETNKSKKLIFLKDIDLRNLKLECQKSTLIDYIEIDDRTFIIEVADKTQNIEAINLCISSIVDIINNFINDQINLNIIQFKFYLEKFPFAFIPTENMGNENLNLLYKEYINLDNKIKKNPIKIEYTNKTIISGFTRVETYFITMFIISFIILLFIQERKKIFIKFKR